MLLRWSVHAEKGQIVDMLQGYVYVFADLQAWLCDCNDLQLTANAPALLQTPHFAFYAHYIHYTERALLTRGFDRKRLYLCQIHCLSVDACQVVQATNCNGRCVKLKQGS